MKKNIFVVFCAELNSEISKGLLLFVGKYLSCSSADIAIWQTNKLIGNDLQFFYWRSDISYEGEEGLKGRILWHFYPANHIALFLIKALPPCRYLRLNKKGMCLYIKLNGSERHDCGYIVTLMWIIVMALQDLGGGRKGGGWTIESSCNSTKGNATRSYASNIHPSSFKGQWWYYLSRRYYE